MLLEKEKTPNTEASKRIIVCCDGTAYSEFRETPFTNVSRISRCIKSVTSLGSPQIVLYVPGIGTGDGNPLSNWWYQGVGIGIDERIISAYSFICHNYATNQDQIILIGYSRGAFIVRCVADLVCKVGLLTKRGLSYLRILYGIWSTGRFKSDERKKNKGLGDNSDHEEDDFGDYDDRKVDGDHDDLVDDDHDDLVDSVTLDAMTPEEFKDMLIRKRLLKCNIKVEVCAVWDTVSSIGLPSVIRGPVPPRFSFVNSELHDGIQHAYQALALHERRQPFLPIVWRASENRWKASEERRKGSMERWKELETRKASGQAAIKDQNLEKLQTLRQCWFAGYHDSIGGGERLEGLSHISLAWMIARLRTHITFDESHFWNPRLTGSAWDWIRAPEEEHGFKVKLNIPNSMVPAYRPLGSVPRKPRRQFWTEKIFELDVDLDKSSDPLKLQSHSDETIHWSVNVLTGFLAEHPCEALKGAKLLSRDKKKSQATSSDESEDCQKSDVLEAECKCRGRRHENEHKHARVWKLQNPTSRLKSDPDFYSVCEEEMFHISYVHASEVKGDQQVKGMEAGDEKKRKVDDTEVQLLLHWFDLELRKLQREAKAGAKESNTALAWVQSRLWEIFEEEYEDEVGEAFALRDY